MLHPRRLPLLAAALGALLSGCDRPAPPQVAAEPPKPGGQATVNEAGPNAFSLPSANLPPSRKVDFSVGNSFFRNPWVIAPSSTTARDGLGPLFNTNACQNCHIKDGRGHPPLADDGSAVSMLVRLSVPAEPGQEALLQRLGSIPEPVYGGQLQDMAIPGHAPEGRVRIRYQAETVTLADGSRVELRKPQLEISDLGYGPMRADTLLSARVAPPMIGLGLLEAIPEAALLRREDPQDRDGDGISGRANRVWDSALNASALGRFGWKAGQPGLNQQNAAAFAGDMGLSSTLHAADDCSAAQAGCRQAPNGNDDNGAEVSDRILASVLFYSRNLAVPARRNLHAPEVQRGAVLFEQAGCAACHTPQHTTSAQAAEPELAAQAITPYTDLLLHDMGEGLADHRPEFLADGREWRTPPLWGIGLTQAVSGHTFFLHDGRARNLLEAILWHGGEGQRARDAVANMARAEREALLQFLNSL